MNLKSLKYVIPHNFFLLIVKYFRHELFSTMFTFSSDINNMCKLNNCKEFDFKIKHTTMNVLRGTYNYYYILCTCTTFCFFYILFILRFYNFGNHIISAMI